MFWTYKDDKTLQNLKKGKEEGFILYELGHDVDFRKNSTIMDRFRPLEGAFFGLI
jgi:hypothetical protein